MSRKSSISWNSNQTEQLKKAVKNYNAKISRLEKKYKAEGTREAQTKLNALPEKVSVADMKNLIGTRKDLAREVNSLKRFTQRGAEELVDVPGSKYNLKTTSWQKKEMSIRLSVINKKRKERYDYVSDLQATLRGKELGYKVGELGMGSVDQNAVTPMKAFYPTMERADLNKRFDAMRLETQEAYWNEKEIRLKENVMKGIEANYRDLDPEAVDKILEAIEKMDFKRFYKKFMSEVGEMEIVSPPPGSSAEDTMRINIETLKSNWIPHYKPTKKDKKAITEARKNRDEAMKK